MDSAKRLISGTWGEIWVNGIKWAECYGLQAKIAYNKEEVAMCGQMEIDTKIKNTKGTFSISLYKVYTRLLDCYDDVSQGKDTRFTIISKLADPDAYGAERVALYNCSVDEETIAAWEAGQTGRMTVPGTFTRREWLDTIAA